jgi:hypothetical protein
LGRRRRRIIEKGCKRLRRPRERNRGVSHASPGAIG